MSAAQLPGCGMNASGHVYKENKLKMAKHSGCLARYLQTSATDLSRKQNETSHYNVDRYHLNHGFHKRRKVEETNSCLVSDISSTQLQCFQSPVLMPQLRCFPHKQPYNFSTSTANASVSNVSGVYATQNSGNASSSVSSKNASKFTTSQGDYAIVVGEILSSSNESYEVLSFLGRGTFGQVVKCRCQSTKRCVAVKILKNLPSYLRQGNVEIQILQTLSQEDTESHNIVRAIECFQHKCHMCFVFELLEQNLYEYLKSNKFRPLALTEIRPIAQQVLTALSKLKALGLIHADLKPENIMLASSTSGPMRYRVKVIDFGSACHSSKAVQNTYLQSRYYRAPEILIGLPFNEAIDMWSLGCVIAELFLGWPLYPGSSEYDQMRYIVETQGLPPTDLLQTAAKTATFFVCDPYRYEWRMKTQEEYTVETGQQAKEARKYFFSSLSQICDVTGISPPDNPEHNCEAEDRQQFANLLMLMLRIRPADRVVPDSALQHPFITMSHLQRHPFSKRFHESMILMQVCHESVRRQHFPIAHSNNSNMKTHQEMQRYNSLTSLSNHRLDNQHVVKNELMPNSRIAHSPRQVLDNTSTNVLFNNYPLSNRKTSITSPSLHYQPQAPANNTADSTAAYYAAAAAAAAAAATALTSNKTSGKTSTIATGATVRGSGEVKYLRHQRYASQTRATAQRNSNTHYLRPEEEHSLQLQHHQLVPAITFLPQSSEPPFMPITSASENRPSTATAAAAAAAAAATVLLAQTNADAYLLRQKQQQQEPGMLTRNPSPSQSTLYGLAIATNGAENALSILNAAAAAAVTQASNTAPLEFVGQSQGSVRLPSLGSGHPPKTQPAVINQMPGGRHSKHTQQGTYLSAMDAERAAFVLSSYLTKERSDRADNSRHNHNQQEPRSTMLYPMMPPPPPPPDSHQTGLPNTLRISSTATVDLQETLNAFVQHQQNRKQQQQQHDLYRNPTAAAAAAAVAALGELNQHSQQHRQGLLTSRSKHFQSGDAPNSAIDQHTLFNTASRPKTQTLHHALVTPQVRSDHNLQHQQNHPFRVPHSIVDTGEILRVPGCCSLQGSQENRLSASFNSVKPHDLRLTAQLTTTSGRTSLNYNAMTNPTASLYRSYPVLPTVRHHQEPDHQPHQVSSQTPNMAIFSSTPITRTSTPTWQGSLNATSADLMLSYSDASISTSGDIVPINLATTGTHCPADTKTSHMLHSQPAQTRGLSASQSFQDVKPQNALLEYESLLQAGASLQESLSDDINVSHETSTSDEVNVTKVEHSFSSTSDSGSMFADCRSTIAQPHSHQTRLSEKKIPVGRVQPMLKQEDCFTSPPRLQISTPAGQRRVSGYSGGQQTVGTLPPLYPLNMDTSHLSSQQHLSVIAAQHQPDAQNSSTARNLSAAHAAAAAYHNIMFFQLQQQQQQSGVPPVQHYQNQLQQILSTDSLPSSSLGYARQTLVSQPNVATPVSWMSLTSTDSSSLAYKHHDRLQQQQQQLQQQQLQQQQQQQRHCCHQQQLRDDATAAAAASYYAAAAAAAAMARHRGRQELEQKLFLIDQQHQKRQQICLLTEHGSDYCAQ